jgi:hypothetical protein
MKGIKEEINNKPEEKRPKRRHQLEQCRERKVLESRSQRRDRKNEAGRKKDRKTKRCKLIGF